MRMHLVQIPRVRMNVFARLVLLAMENCVKVRHPSSTPVKIK